MTALRVGLTGGIGSGKSEVTRRLAARGAVVIDADQVARAVVAPGTPGLAAVVDAFGPDVLAADGGLDRDRLAAIVFTDPAARERLNAIVHPLVRAETARRMTAAPPDAIVVNDVPLLVETGSTDRYDVIVVVSAFTEAQLARLTGLRGMPELAARARIEAQASSEERLAVADFVIDNDGSLSALDEQVDRLWAALLRRAGRAGSPAGPG